jgi:hypothetical protein
MFLIAIGGPQAHEPLVWGRAPFARRDCEGVVPVTAPLKNTRRLAVHSPGIRQ